MLRDTSWVFGDNPAVLQTLQGHLQGIRSPEQINENPNTTPSRRLLAVYLAYQKTLHGPMAVGAASVARLRPACPHFDQWLARLEKV